MSILTEHDKGIVHKQFDALLKHAPRVTKKAERELIRKAFHFANEAHENQKRKSGEPYILHPIAVARIVAEEMGLGTVSICAALLPAVMKVNASLLAEKLEYSEKLLRFEEIARWVTGDAKAGVQDLVEWFSLLAADLKIQPLSSFGVRKKDFPAIIEKASRSSSMKGNPVPLNDVDMARILELAL